MLPAEDRSKNIAHHDIDLVHRQCKSGGYQQQRHLFQSRVAEGRIKTKREFVPEKEGS